MVYGQSKSAAKIVEIGSMKLDLHQMAINIFATCLKDGISLDIQWIPREQNTRAYYLSHIIDPDGWQITLEFYTP